MLVTILVFGFTLYIGFCKEFPVGVRLLLPTPPEEVTQACQLLRDRSPELWDKGFFLRCFARQPIITDEGNFIVPYSVTVNSSKIDYFPKDAKYADKVAFINQQLNFEMDSCRTVTGSNWCKPLDKFDSSFPVEVHIKGDISGPETLDCDELLAEILSTNEHLSQVSCRQEQDESTTPHINQRHRFLLQLQISPNRDHPPTKDILLSLLKFSSTLGSVYSKCIQFISAKRDPSTKSWTVFVNVPVSAETPPSCDMFGGRSPHINFECESLETQDDKDTMRFKLDYSDALNRQLMDPLDSIEAQMFINWYLNGQIMGCPVIRYDITHHHFDKAYHKGYFTAVISGPLPKTFCQEMKQQTAYVAHSCASRGNIHNPYGQIGNAVFYLGPQEPFYRFDLPWYMNKYNELINQLNERKLNCEFNGFINLYRGDILPKTQIQIP